MSGKAPTPEHEPPAGRGRRAERRAELRACPRRRKRRRRTRQCGYGVLALVLGALAALLILTRSPLATRLIVPRLSDMTSTPIEADRAWIGIDGRIVLEGARFFVPGMTRPTEKPGPQASFFEVDRAVVWMDWSSVVSGGMPVVDTIELSQPLFRLSHDTESGRLNIAGLSFLMQDAGLGSVSDDFHLPVLVTTGGVIEIGEHTADAYTPLKRIPVDGELIPMALPGGQTFGFRLRQVAEPGVGGRPALDISGRYDDNGLAITLEEFVLSDWSSDVVPSRVRDLYERLDLSGAIGETTLRVTPSGTPSATMALEGVGVTLPFDLAGATPASDAAVRMENTTGTIEISAEGVRADLAGLLDELSYHVTLDSDGVEPTSPFRCVLTTNTRLDENMRLLFAAPEAVRHPLGFFIDPRADIEAVVRLERGPGAEGGAPGAIRKTGELRFANGSASYANFAYRFENLEGVARFDDTTLSIDALRGTHPNGARLSATGTFAPLGATSEVDLQVRVEDVPIDDELRAALSPARRKMVDALFSERRHGALIEAGLVSEPGSGAAAPGFEFGGRADVDVHIRRELGEESIWSRTIEVLVPRAGLVPDHFPLPMVAENVSIIIDERDAILTGGIYRGVSGGTAEVEAHVSLADEHGNPVRNAIPEVQIRAKGIPVDARLRAAIPGYGSSEPGERGTLRDILDRLGLEGTADCEALIGSRADGSLGYEVRAAVDDLSSRPVPWDRARLDDRAPLTLTGVGGTLEVNEHEVTLDMRGGLVFEDSARAPAPVHLAATIGYQRERPGFERARRGADAQAGPPAPNATLDVLVEADGLDLSAPLEHAVAVFSADWGERAAGWRAENRPEGIVDASAHFTGHLNGGLFAEVSIGGVERASWGEGAERVDVGRSVGTLTISTGPEPWVRAEGVSAPVWFGGERVGTIRANGELPLVRRGEGMPHTASPAWGSRMTVALDGASFESVFTRRLAEDRLDEKMRGLLADHRVAGTYDLRLDVAPRPGGPVPAAGPGAGTLDLPALDVAGSVGPRSVAFDLRGERVELANVGGWVRFGDDGGMFDRVTVTGDAWRGLIDGRWSYGDADGAHIEAALDVSTDAGLPEGVLALLPGAITDAMAGLELDADGPVTARDIVLTLDRPAAAEAEWSYAASGEVLFEGAGLDAGVDVRDAAGSVDFRAARAPDEENGWFRLDILGVRARVSGVRTTGVAAEVRSGRAPGEILVPRLEADAHGGRLAGSARVHRQGDETRFWTELVASGVRAAPVFDDLGVPSGAGEPASMTAMANPDAIREAKRADERAWNNTADLSRGTIEGSFSLSGAVGDPRDRAGRGTVQVTGGRVLELPGLLQLIEFSNLQAPVGESLSMAQASFYIEGPTVTFEQMSVFSRSVEIFGYGTMAMPGKELELQFNSRSVNPIPVVSQMLEGLRDELITTRVRGTPGELELSTEQLPGARRILRSIFGDGPTREEQRLRDVESRARESQLRAARTASRAADRAAMEPRPGVVIADGEPAERDGGGAAPTLVVQPTDDE